MYTSEQLEPLIDSLYEASMDASRWPAFLNGLAGSLNGTLPTLFIHDTQQHSGALSLNVGYDRATIDSYQRHFAERNLWLRGGAHLLFPGKVRTSHMMCSQREFLRSDWYSDYCQPLGITQGIGATLLKDATQTSNIAVFSDEHHELGAEQIRLVAALVPHLQRALKVHQHLSQLQVHTGELVAALNGLSTGVVLISARGRVLFMNQAAQAIIDARDGLAVDAMGLRASRPTETSALRKLIGFASLTSLRKGHHAGGTLKITRHAGRPPLSLVISPIRAHAVFTLTERAVASVYISEPQLHGFDVSLGQLYRLTPAETKVAAAILEGLSGSEAAAHLGIRYNTLKTHLKRIFQKTGTRRQAELIRLLVRVGCPVRTSSS